MAGGMCNRVCQVWKNTEKYNWPGTLFQHYLSKWLYGESNDDKASKSSTEMALESLSAAVAQMQEKIEKQTEEVAKVGLELSNDQKMCKAQVNK